MTKLSRKQLERDLIIARQERDQAVRRAEDAEAKVVRLTRERNEARTVRPLHTRVTEPIRQWLDELSTAVGL